MIREIISSRKSYRNAIAFLKDHLRSTVVSLQAGYRKTIRERANHPAFSVHQFILHLQINSWFIIVMTSFFPIPDTITGIFHFREKLRVQSNFCGWARPFLVVTLFTVMWFRWIHFVVDLDCVCGQKVYVSSSFRQYKIRFLVLLKLRNPLALFNKRCT